MSRIPIFKPVSVAAQPGRAGVQPVKNSVPWNSGLRVPEHIVSGRHQPPGTLLYKWLRTVRVPTIADPHTQADRSLERAVLALLEGHWPGNNIKVVADHRGGILKMNMPPLMCSPAWYVIPLRQIYSDPSGRLVMRGAGEILERYRLPTVRWSQEGFMEKVRTTRYEDKRKGLVPE